MSLELIYTSVPRGLKPGSKGFCTVAMTLGLSTAWAERLESLSGYRPIFALGDANSQLNPVNWSYWRITLGGVQRGVLSRVAFAGADYSQRSNKLAHHVVLEPSEQAPGGPAWMMLQAGALRTSWNGEPEQTTSGPIPPRGDRPPRVCSAWERALGDAGWAGLLVESFVNEPGRPVYLICDPGTNVLELFEESQALMPPQQRWDVTFSTFFTELPLNLSCAWRAVIVDTPAAQEAVRLGRRALVLDLTRPTSASPPSSIYTDAARSGSGPAKAVTSSPTQTVDQEKTGGELEQELDLPSETKSRGRNRLASMATTPLELQEELPTREEVRISSAGIKFPAQVIVVRGVSGWFIPMTAAVCLAIGSGIGFIAGLRHGEMGTNRESIAETNVSSTTTAPSHVAFQNDTPVAAPTRSASTEPVALNHPNAPMPTPTTTAAPIVGLPSDTKIPVGSGSLPLSDVPPPAISVSTTGELTPEYSAPEAIKQCTFQWKSDICAIQLPPDCPSGTVAQVIWPTSSLVYQLQDGHNSQLSFDAQRKVIQLSRDSNGGLSNDHKVDLMDIKVIKSTIEISTTDDGRKEPDNIKKAVRSILNYSAFLIPSANGPVKIMQIPSSKPTDVTVEPFKFQLLQGCDIGTLRLGKNENAFKWTVDSDHNRCILTKSFAASDLDFEVVLSEIGGTEGIWKMSVDETRRRELPFENEWTEACKDKKRLSSQIDALNATPQDRMSTEDRKALDERVKVLSQQMKDADARMEKKQKPYHSWYDEGYEKFRGSQMQLFYSNGVQAVLLQMRFDDIAPLKDPP